MKTVLSASRRTDLPAHYMDWCLQKLHAGSVGVKNPFNPNQVREVSLRQQDVHSIVFWSKNFAPLIAALDELAGYHLYLHFTINDAPLLEPRIPPLPERLEQLRLLTKELGPERVNWRFDPVVLWDGGRSHNLGSFPRIAEVASQLGLGRCTFSFAHWYRKSIKRAELHGFPFHLPTREEILEHTEWMKKVADSFGLVLQGCCAEVPLEVPGVTSAACVDGVLLSRLKGEPADTTPHPSRKGCGCTQSIDIGHYTEQSCLSGCVYCYACPKVDLTR